MDRTTLTASTVALALGLGLVTTEAGAAPPIVRAESTCPTLVWSSRTFVDLLRVELRADHVEVTTDGNVQDAPIVTATPETCGDGARGATIVLRRGEQRTERYVELSDVPANAKARVLALAAADLLRANFAASAPPPPAAPAPFELHVVVDAPPAPAVVAATPILVPPAPPPPPPRALTLSLTGEARSFPSASTGLFGGRLSLASPLGRWFSLGVDADVGAGSARDALGSVTTLVLGGAVGVALAAGPDAFRVHLGPKLEVDWVRFAASGNLATTLASAADSAVVLLMLSATAHVRVIGGLYGLIGLDAGASLRGYEARADGRTVAGVIGPMLGLRIGIAWSPGTP